MLQISIDWILYTVLSLAPESQMVQTLNFFIYDSIKILILLLIMISIIGFFRTYISQKKIKEVLSRQKFGSGNLIASLFGAITPFCSCSSIPIFLSFTQAGVPLGTTLSFLITSPLVNEYLVVLMLGFFGWKITVAYVIFGILIGTVSGMIMGKMNLEKYLEKDIRGKEIKDSTFSTINTRIKFGIHEALSIIKKLWIWILVAVGIGAFIHNYVPQEWIQNLVGSAGIFAIPLAVILGVPMYGSCAAIVPIAVVLFQKGLPLGTALAFMMAISALSFPEAVILRRAMKLKLIAIFFSVVTIAIIIVGYIFNFLQNTLI